MNRRNFLHRTGILTGAFLSTWVVRLTNKSNPTILVVSGWQDVNIGDIAHTPGFIDLLMQRLPDTNIILWKKSKSERVEAMLARHYPRLKVIHGGVDGKNPQSEAVREAFEQADIFIHGSGPAVLAGDYLNAWAEQTTKPFGLFGVTTQHITPFLKDLLMKASFILTRETASIQVLKENGISGENIRFAPDATFAMKIRNDEKAAVFIREKGLVAKQFICVVPRLRLTPYYETRPNNAGWSAERINEVRTFNDKFKEEDHAKVREAMITWVRKTGKKIVLCPEMTYQVNIMDELLFNPLPEDVKPFVIKHDYWMPDEAASFYSQAHTVLSYECHSPIIALANGTPAFYIRQPEDTIKGQMYYDLGLDEWTFEVMNVTGKDISDRLMQVYENYDAARLTVQQAQKRVEKQYDEAFRTISRSLEGSTTRQYI